MGKKSKKATLTWQFGQPVHIEDKKEVPGLRPEFKGECLYEQVDRIVGKDTKAEDILACLPWTIRVRDIVARLEISKGTDLVYHACYKDSGNTYFYEAQPTLRLTLFRLLEDITEASREKKNKNEDEVDSENKDFTWEIGQPITREQKKLRPDFKKECLDEQVDRITGRATVEELLKSLPRRLKYDSGNSMRLKIEKGSSGIIWYAGYYLHIDEDSWDMQETYVEKVTCPDLRLALYMLKQKIQRYESNG